MTAPLDLDAIEALPVIATCGECGWYQPDRDGAYGGRRSCCSHVAAVRLLPTPAQVATGARYRIQYETTADAVPPAWCPLRGAR